MPQVSSRAALAPKSCWRCGAIGEGDALYCSKDGTKLDEVAASATPAGDPYIGTVISGDIEILSVAGVGAMAASIARTSAASTATSR